MNLLWYFVAVLMRLLCCIGDVCAHDVSDEPNRFVSDDAQREKARYEFLQHCFSPEYFEDSQSIGHKIKIVMLALGTSGLASFLGVSLLWKVPLEGFIALPSWAMFVMRNAIDIKTLESKLFGALVVIVAALLYPCLYRLIRGFCVHQIDYASILIDFIRDWPDYRICTPQEFHQFFETLYLVFYARGKRLCLTEDMVILFVAMINEAVEDELGYDPTGRGLF